MNRLKELRLEHELTQVQLAKAIKTSQRNISRWEKNEIEMGLNFAISLANYFSVSVEYLAGETDDFGVKMTAASAASNYTAEERQIIEAYRKLNGPGQKLVKDVIKNLQAGSRAATSTENKSDKRV